jgi:hypothetical protein
MATNKRMWFAWLAFIGCQPHECVLDRECVPVVGAVYCCADGGCAPDAPVCREYHCVNICPVPR